jgi:Family of unknown function (DUF6152)
MQRRSQTMKKCMQFLLVSLSLLPGSVPLLAHHSFAAEYDDAKPMKVTGVVTKVEWQNPHIWFYLDAKDESGKTVSWACSGGAPGQLMRRGITKDVLKLGSTINVEGFRAKDGSNNCWGGKVTFQDGRSVFTAGEERSADQTKR